MSNEISNNNNKNWRNSFPCYEQSKECTSPWINGFVPSSNSNNTPIISQKRSNTFNTLNNNSNKDISSSFNNDISNFKNNNDDIRSSTSSIDEENNWSFYCSEQIISISAPVNSFGNLTEFDLSSILEPRPVKQTRLHELIKGKLRERIGRLINNEEMRKEGKAIEKGATDYEINLNKAHERAKRQIQMNNIRFNNNTNNNIHSNNSNTNWNSIVPITVQR